MQTIEVCHKDRMVTVQVDDNRLASIVKGRVGKDDKYSFRRRIQDFWEHRTGQAKVCPLCGRGNYIVTEELRTGSRSALCCRTRFEIAPSLSWVA